MARARLANEEAPLGKVSVCVSDRVRRWWAVARGEGWLVVELFSASLSKDKFLDRDDGGGERGGLCGLGSVTNTASEHDIH